MITSELYIGLMSGTSLDAIDAVLVDFCHGRPEIIATHQHPFSKNFRQAILELCTLESPSIQSLGEMDAKLGHLFAQSVIALLEKTNYSAGDIAAVGSHGQTIRHSPHSQYPFTWQIGDPNIIAEETQIVTVADFRRRDMALGGQAAPLAPAFHHYFFQVREKDTGVLNIGGIANLTFLPANLSDPIIGFDTGPGNTLLDAWCLQHTDQPYDKNGNWALQGRHDKTLLAELLNDPYFSKHPPKSTGREYFHLNWLREKLSNLAPTPSPADIQATLLELTAQSIADAIDIMFESQPAQNDPKNIWVCGGGAHNTALIARLNQLSQHPISSIETTGISPDWVESTAFAWLARQTLLGKPGNIPSVTGAKASCVLGAIYTQCT